MRLPLLALLTIAACDAPHSSRVSRALELRAGQSFQAVPPEASVRAPVRERVAPARAASGRAIAAVPAAVASVDTLVPLGPPHMLVAFADSVVLAPGDSTPLSVSALDDPIATDAGVRIDVEPAAATALHASTARVFADDADKLNVVLLPTVWRVRGGRWNGTTMPIQSAAALPRTGGFARLHDSPSEPGARVVGWPLSRLPIRLTTAADIPPADTAAFWETARAVERDLGMRLFVPAGANDAGTRAVEVRVGPTGGSEAVTHASWSAGGDVDDAEMVLRSSSVLRDRGIVAHELLHLLGFGHNSAWPSVLSAGGSRAPGWLTAEDVAWTQLLYRLRETQAREGAGFGLGAARLQGTGNRE